MKKRKLKPWLIFAAWGLYAIALVFLMHLSDDLRRMRGLFTLHITIASFTVLMILKV